MPTVTQSRVVECQNLDYRLNGGLKTSLWTREFGLPMQVTTSYRGTRGEDDSFDDDLLGSGSRGEMFRTLRDEHQSRASSYDTGHPFRTSKQKATFSHPSVKLSRNGKTYEGPLVLDGRYYAAGYRMHWPVIPDFTSGFYGPRAISATRPTSPHVSLATALGELRREGLPSLPGLQSLSKRSAGLRNAGGEYLNVEFGWKPLVADVQATARTVADAKSIIEQFRRDSGKNIRRGYTFPIEETRTNWIGDFNTSYLLDVPNTGSFKTDFAISGSGKFHERLHTKRKIWFKGAYTYHLPEGGSLWEDLLRFESMANHLFGLRLNPEVLWNLTPWSWFADWNGNLGMQIANASALSEDGLVMRFGYLMCETTQIHEMWLDNVTCNGVSVGSVYQSFETTKKERVQASPYGFGSNPASYTSRQWAILGALGMTKSPTQIRYA